MPEKSLGIDIGDGSITTVLVSSARGGYVVDTAQVKDISEGGLAGALDLLRDKDDVLSVNMKLSLPAEFFSFHNVRLPFGESKKIKQTIAFELETLLPHGVDDCLIDYNVIKRSKQSEILAALIHRSTVKEKISGLGEELPEINVVTIGALPIASLLLDNGLMVDSWLLLDIGERKAAAIFVYGEKIVAVRSYDFRKGGGRSEAGVMDGSGVDAGGAFCRDIANTVECLKWGGIMEDGPSAIYITGGGSKNRGLKEELARHFSLPVEDIDLAAMGGIELSSDVEKIWDPPVMNGTLALAIYEHRKGRGFNFPLMEGKSKAGEETLIRSIKRGAVFLLIPFLLVAVDSYLDYRFAKLRLENIKKEITSVFRGSVPDVGRIVDPVQQFKTRIAEAKRVFSGLGLDGGSTVIAILKDISALAPQSTEFLITGFNLDGDRLTIKGQAKNFDAVEVIKRELAGSKYFKSVQIGATSLARQGDRVEFDLRITTQR